VIEALRALPAGAAAPLAELGRQIKEGFGDDDLPWMRKLVEGLARDGLVALDGEAASLPT
jgi:hypothetical protein